MEAQTATTPSDAATGSKTLADLLPLAVEKHAAKVAQKFKDQSTGEWVDVSYPELGQIAKEVSLGLQELGIDRGDKVGILSNTRPEWTYADFGILATGGTVVPIYQTNSPEECHYVLEHSESVAVILEDQSQLDKIRKVRDQLPSLRHVISMEPLDGDDVMSMEELRERGRGRSDDDFKQRVATVEGSDVATYIYTSGTTGPPKGCVIDHQNWRDMLDMVQSQNVLMEDEVAYLFLPLAHAFARLIQLGSLDVGATIVYWERDPQKIIPNLMEVKPTYFPSVPRMFEKIYSLANSNAPDKAQLEQAVQLGLKVRQMQDRGEAVPAELQEAFDKADAALFQNVRNIFGGRIKQAVTGAAPIAQEILEFFYACGVLVLEGWGMTETSTAATCNTAEEFRFGSVGKPFPGVEVKIAADGEILARGPNIFRGYYKNPEATAETIVDRWLHTGDIGRIDEDGFLYITGRKKDIIITAGGKNITPANLENGLKQNQYISQAVVHGDRRPFLTALITLDPEEIVPWAQAQGIEDTDMASLAQNEKVQALVQEAVDKVNEKVARVEEVKKFTILPHDLTQETGELTPTLKVKRNVVNEKYAGELDAMYRK
ncbi:MAG TPA: AMP-dependent synthetase/ligase [Solirubrobacterales bacterium]|nr:AMP-dependent synthetase/ligase [Solirubrobacterales bacterium]